jgi:mannose-6-phosphate isomerase-like protein (cupin superfamily)
MATNKTTNQLKINLESKTKSNKFYRKVLYTTEQLQLVIMSIPINDDIKLEKHVSTTQFIRVEKGNGYAIISGKKFKLCDGDAIIIPQNTEHYIKNTGKTSLQLYTIYSPPEHAIATIEKNNPNK